jgi:hypothetical protein
MLPTALTRGRSTLDDLGQGLVTSAYRTGGNAAVDDLLRRPPTTQEHLLDPWTLVGDQQDAIGVREAHVAPTDRSVEAGTFGAVGWLVLLGGRLPAGQALEASLGWGGDAYQLVERRGGKTCLRINYTGDTPTDTREMSAALHAWAGAAPARITNVSREGSLVRFETCEAAALGQPTSGSALAVRLALARNHLTASLVSAGARWAEARCGADRLAQILTVAELDDVRVQGPRAQRVLAGCRNT